jgi:hypothetical protein
MKHLILILAALASLLVDLRHATAGILVDTTGAWNGSRSIGPFGPGPLWATIGETISVPTGYSVLEDFGFEIEAPADMLFRGEVYAWNGSEAVGPSLFESAATHTAGTGNFELITFDTGGVQLSAGQQYVFFVSVSRDFSADSNVFVPGLLGGGYNLYDDAYPPVP